jgi:hypothetical protein
MTLTREELLMKLGAATISRRVKVGYPSMLDLKQVGATPIIAIFLTSVAVAARACPLSCEDTPKTLALARVVATQARLNFVA